ncbi:MAG: tRNA threonylcarbamoyladenosine dehydratase [Muribaculaceae bacterium]|nr:tRNA threonylcarbamoyladenosine dehydratase [Muribaculaceae bacterium]
MNNSEVWDARTRTLLGDRAVERLSKARVAVVGTGGVGGYAVEALARSGVGNMLIIDADEVAPSNLNRQLIALHSTLGKNKVEIFAERCKDINPEIKIEATAEFVTPENASELIGTDIDFVIDAIDTVAPKMAVIAHCLQNRIAIISSMGAGGRTDPAKIGYFDLSETREDGLARAVRQRMKKMGLRRNLKVVASTEAPHRNSVIELNERNKRSSFGTIITIPAIFGLYLANHVIMKLCGSSESDIN